MIAIGDTLLSEDIFSEYFVCDLAACKGACCVEGESGAPLEPDELREIEVNYPHFSPFMTSEGREVVATTGFYERDMDDELVTPLMADHGACAYVYFDDQGVAKCAIEKSFQSGGSKFRKPISCHLYPIRLLKVNAGIGVNYHRWPICKPACDCGSKLKVPVYRFLRDALIRRFGEVWYSDLEHAYLYWKEHNHEA